MVIEKKKVTYDEYEAFISRPENADKIFELIDGEIAEKMPSYYSLLDEDVITVGMDGVLDGKDVLPGFTLAVKDIFK